jgi:prepilin-type N-terminal cleavage/methylation domain-containing protein
LKDGFTIIELLVVIAIIGALAAISLPALKGISQSRQVSNASQQLLDDLALARQYAINNRAFVHVVFVPPMITNMTFASSQDLAKRLMTHAYASYAFYAERTVGDQPGQARPRYLSRWKSLPDGVFIAPNEFTLMRFKDWEGAINPVGRPFRMLTEPENKTLFPFPTLTNAAVELPHITFSPKGSCVFLDTDKVHKPFDEVIELARGSILAVRDENNGNLLYFDVRESPPNNSIDNYNRIRIDGLTGRATLERPEIGQPQTP